MSTLAASRAGIGSSEQTRVDERTLPRWDGELVVSRHDEATGAWMFVCLHSTQPGPAAGGTRMSVYRSPSDGLGDAMRLSAAMTSKLAIAGLPFGGGKGVLAVPEIPYGRARRGLLQRYGELVDSLGGAFLTGPDMNTGPRDMDVVGERTRYALCRSVERGGCGSSTPATARGVLHGIRASVEHVFGSPALAGRTILVQGVGGVGGALAELLAADGARVLLSDIDRARARSLARRLAAGTVDPRHVIGTECDVFAPCATGGILSEATIPLLRCRIVAGAANNQLVTERDAERLRAAGILYAPDYVINAGGAIFALGVEVMRWSREEVERRLARIGCRLRRIYDEADRDGVTTDGAAMRLVRPAHAARTDTVPATSGLL